MAETIAVSITFAAPGVELCEELQVAPGSTIADALLASGVAARTPGWDGATMKAGLWGRLKPATTVLREGDRIELYRPLKADPNTARQHRVEKKRAAAGK